MAADGDDERDWVQQVHQTEQALVDVISLDGDLVVEALSNIPPDARGRLRTMLVLAEEVVVQAAHGYHIVVDTGLGTAGWYAEPDEPQPAVVAAADGAGGAQHLGLAPGQAWADTTDVPVLSLQSDPAVAPSPAQQPEQPAPTAEAPTDTAASQVADTSVTTQEQPTQVQPSSSTQPAPQPDLRPLSKAATKGKQPPQQPMVAHITVKAQPQPQPQLQPQAQQPLVPVKSRPQQPQQPHPGQPEAKAPTVPPPPPLGTQRGTPGVGPVLGSLRQPPPQPKQPVLERPFQPDQAALAAFPNDLVSFNAGLFIANYSAVGDRGLLPDSWPYNAAFPPLCLSREPRLPRSLRDHGHRTSGFCLATCSQCQRRACSRAVTDTKDGGVAHSHHDCSDCHSRRPPRRHHR